MKKYFNNIRTLAALLMAGAAFAACSSSDDNTVSETQQPVNPTGKYIMTVKASKGSDVTTRALEIGRNATDTKNVLNATWDENEVVLVYQDGSKIGTLYSAASSTEETTLTGALDSDPDDSKDLTLYFHTAATPSYSGQDGTLSKIALSYDFCEPATVATGDFTVNTSDKTITADGVTFGANQQAIAKFTLVDKADGTTTLSPSVLTVSVGVSSTAPTYVQSAAAAYLPYENSLTIPAATYTENGAGIIYLAIPDKVTAMLASMNATIQTMVKGYLEFTLTATVGSDTYTLTKSGFPFENGKYYEITAKMTKQAPAEEVWKLTPLANISTSDVFVIASGSYAMTNDNGTSSAPSAVSISTTTVGGVTKITSTVEGNMKWNLTKSGSDYTFYPNGDAYNWLCFASFSPSSNNNNMRVGTGDRKVFVLSDNKLVTHDDYTARYLSLYNESDWRGYTSGGSDMSFYVLQ